MPTSRCSSRSSRSNRSWVAPKNARQVRCSSASSQRGSAMFVTLPFERSTTCYRRGEPQEVRMPVHRLNHAVLYVSDVERSAAFYRDTLGFRTTMAFPPDAMFLAAPGSTSGADLGLFQAD